MSRTRCTTHPCAAPMRRFAPPLIAVLAALTSLVVLPACTPEQDLARFSTLELHTSIGGFTRWWKAEQAAALRTSLPTIERYWDQRSSRLDGARAAGRYFDVSTDFCSRSPNTGPAFDFRAACVRHDFAWRNLKKMDARHRIHRFDTSRWRVATTEQFHADMDAHCAGRHRTVRPACRAISDLYYRAVLLVA